MEDGKNAVIKYDPEHRTFTIYTDRSAYQMQVDDYGYLLHLYYGALSEGCMDWVLTYADRGFSGNPYDTGGKRTYSMDFLPQEYPSQGSGDYRSTAFILKDEAGTYGCDLRYRSYEIRRGKYSLKGLPAVYSDADIDDAWTLSVVLGNNRTGVEVELLYGVLPHLDIITRSAVVTNRGGFPVQVEKLASACLDMVSGDYDLITFHGRHAMERVPERSRIGHHASVTGSRRGMSSHQYNPFAILAEKDAAETCGRCWSMQYVYSGGFRTEAERDQFDQTRLVMGLATEKFSYPLRPGEKITAPEVIMSYSSAGFERLSHNLHECIRKHVCRGKYRDMPRPVLLNSWEASYFRFTGDSIVELAEQAADLGMDMLVMDDGWFGDRDDDTRSLGDWTANEKKLGCTLGELISKVNDAGVKFGIWVEPEMINEDSDLYRAHPDWALAIPGENPVLARNQLVLDFSRQEVTDSIYEAICGILDQGNIEYLKWDYNRSIEDVYSYTAEDQGKVLYDYILGLYSVLERLCAKYPDLLIEGCSGGGGRFDAGMLYYTPQIWCSDNTDAIDRLMIQYGTSFGYPPIVTGAHVSACPNHQTGRVTPLRTRGITAMSGAFGYELDPASLSGEEREEIREQIRFYRETEALIRNGMYFRLSDPAAGPVSAWEFVSEDGCAAMVSAVVPQSHGNAPVIFIRPRGLRPGVIYRDEESGREYYSDALMETGFPLPAVRRDAESFLYILRAQNLSD